jgi:IS30 family transposase
MVQKQHCWYLVSCFAKNFTMAHRHGTAQFGFAVPLITERYNFPQHSTSRICRTAIYRTVQWPTTTALHCEDLLYRYVLIGRMAHNTALLGSAVPLRTERYNVPQHSTARICRTAIYRTVQWPTATPEPQHSTARICCTTMYRSVQWPTAQPC